MILHLFILQITVLELIFFSGLIRNWQNRWIRYNNYKVSIEEIHHTKKLDAPSGTAITLAEGIIKNHSEYDGWAFSDSEAAEK